MKNITRFTALHIYEAKRHYLEHNFKQEWSVMKIERKMLMKQRGEKNRI